MNSRLLSAWIVLAIIGLLLGLFVIYQRQQPRVLAEVVWEAPHNRPKPGWVEDWTRRLFQPPRPTYTHALNSSSSLPEYHAERVVQPDGTDEIKMTWTGKTPMGGPTLADFMFVKGLTPGANYAVVGAIRRADASSFCRVQLTSLIFVGTVKKEGRIANQTDFDLGPSTDWQPFVLVVDESKLDFNLSGFLVNLSWGGPNTIEVRDLKFVQYSGTMAPSKLTTASIASSATDSWIVTGFVVGLLASAGSLLMILRRERHERELRRIASLDS